MSPIKLARTYRVGHDAVIVSRTCGDRIPSGEYCGLVDGAFANHICERHEFSVKLPTNGYRRQVACKILVSPVDVTVVVQPTIDQALAALYEFFVVSPNNDGLWHCSIIVKVADNATRQYFAVGMSPSVAVCDCERKLRDLASEWYDADPSIESGASFVNATESPDAEQRLCGAAG